MNIFHLNEIRDQAEHAAEQGMGPQACQYQADSAAAEEWRTAYYARIRELAVECAS